MQAPTHRRAVRIVCFDPLGRVLLLHWRDPGTGRLLWEPPGGGVEAGEAEPDAARRELLEETGIAAILDNAWAVEVERDFTWNGRRFLGPERFFGLRLDSDSAIDVTPHALTESETHTYLGAAWFLPSEFGTLADDVEPPNLEDVVAALG